MKPLNSWCPPFPMVGVGDAASGEFTADAATMTAVDGDVVIRFEGLRTSNRTVSELVQQGLATAVVKVTCEATYLRSTEPVAVPDGEIRLAGLSLTDEVIANLRIISTCALRDYCPEGLHGDYAGFTFAVEPGDILAEGPEFKFLVDPSFDPLRAPVSSIMRVRKVEDRFEGYRINYDSNRIVVEFSDAEWRKYQRLKNGVAAAVLHAAVVLPVLTEAVFLVKSQGQEHEGELWFRRLASMMEGRPEVSTGKPAAEIAQLLLKGPFARAASQLLQDDGEN
ncbi:hypothetical protein [Luteitalea sp.]|uniref:hypothetical protein n=1 Tax=Luteitalea sp. TaxID=2004800 RepID=UPI0025C17435|nr:hypothetical protein [Luteitalea sp.]